MLKNKFIVRNFLETSGTHLLWTASFNITENRLQTVDLCVSDQCSTKNIKCAKHSAIIFCVHETEEP